MQQNYASDKNWANAIGNVMNQFAIDLGDNETRYTQYPPNTSTSAPAPPTTAEPVYYLNGAKGVVQHTPYYNSLPVYPDMASGVKQMFARPLQLKDQGDDVATLQAALNQQLGTQLDTDGKFGPMTEAAVKQYQASLGTVTGICDFNMWQSLKIGAGVQQLAPGTVVDIDQMKIGMAGGTAIDWYHIPGLGWVNGNDVSFKNVYRLPVANMNSPSQVSVPVYSASNSSTVIARLRAGDFVVSTGSTSGTVTIQFADQSTGQLKTGVVKGITLTKVPNGS
jgi:peptidoglycan hydrolase-like protein with peptidoglycan-binding domain